MKLQEFAESIKIVDDLFEVVVPLQLTQSHIEIFEALEQAEQEGHNKLVLPHCRRAGATTMMDNVYGLYRAMNTPYFRVGLYSMFDDQAIDRLSSILSTYNLAYKDSIRQPLQTHSKDQLLFSSGAAIDALNIGNRARVSQDSDYWYNLILADDCNDIDRITSLLRYTNRIIVSVPVPIYNRPTWIDTYNFKILPCLSMLSDRHRAVPKEYEMNWHPIRPQ